MKSKILSNKEIAAFCTQLSILISAGITPLESISFMLEDSEQGEEQSILLKIQSLLFEGETLSSAISSTKIFPSYLVDMMVLGEETGSLELTLKNLADYYDQQHSIKEAIKNALIYPFIMTSTMFFMILILLINVLPTINQVYKQLGSTISGFSGFLFSLSAILQKVSYGIYFIFFIAVLTFIFLFYKFQKAGQAPSFLYHFRFVNSLANDKASSQFASCLALVTSSGIDLYLGLTLIQKIIHSTTLKNKIDLCLKYLQEDGDFIYEALQKAEIFHPVSLRMLQIGYKSGNPDDVLKKISKDYEQHIHISLDRLLNTVEPTLVIIFSIIIGLILISTLLPLIGIMANIG